MSQTAQALKPENTSPSRPGAKLLLSHPAHFLSLGAGSGLSPFAPGTVGTLYAWLSFLVLNLYVNDQLWALIIGIGAVTGVWITAYTARALNTQDPSAVVWDEIIAFWLVLWITAPAGLWAQCVAFALFRYFDATKPGPVGWADKRFKGGLGIMLDDLIAAGCTLIVMALWMRITNK